MSTIIFRMAYLRDLLTSLSGGLIDLVYPRICWVCRQRTEAEAICSECERQLVTDPHPTCPRCSSSVGPFVDLSNGCVHCRDQRLAFDAARRLGPYAGVLRQTVLRLKQPGGEGLAHTVAKLWANAMAPRLQDLAIDVVMPIPLHWTRRLSRGFDQGEVLAESLARRLAVPCITRCLYRVRATPQQVAQDSPTARLGNVRNAFACRPHFEIAGRTVLLVDDVLTTGATASEAARAVIAAYKPRRVAIAVLAHGR